jgi:hypothetical protein
MTNADMDNVIDLSRMRRAVEARVAARNTGSDITSRVYLDHLDGRRWASTGFLRGTGPTAAWEWIATTVAAELDCSEEEVGCMECTEGNDLVTVDGLPVYRCRIVYC